MPEVPATAVITTNSTATLNPKRSSFSMNCSRAVLSMNQNLGTPSLKCATTASDCSILVTP